MSAGENFNPLALKYARTLYKEYAEALFTVAEGNSMQSPHGDIQGKFWKLHESVASCSSLLTANSPLLIVTNKEGGNLAIGIVFVQSQEVGLEFMKLSETHANQLQMKGIVSSTWPIVLVLQLVRTERIKPVLSSFKYA